MTGSNNTQSHPDWVRAYQSDGYVAIEGLLRPEEVEELKAEAASIARGDRGEVLGAHAAPGAADETVLGEVLAIHLPHKVSAVMRQAMRHPAIVAVLRDLIGPDVKSMQTMLFVKRAGKPGQAWHQDEHFIPTRDRSLCGVWIALDDATVENGCLWMHPGSHAPGILYPMQPHGEDRFDTQQEAHGFPYEREGGVAVELKAGGVAFFNGYTLHRSLRNDAPHGFRRALVTHYMNARSLLPWNIFPSARPRDDFRDIEMISGEDPYSWRGTESVLFPFVRPDNPDRAAEVSRQLAARLG
jgi:hypothetical protein